MFEFTDDLLTGISAIDDEHKGLFCIVGEDKSYAGG